MRLGLGLTVAAMCALAGAAGATPIPATGDYLTGWSQGGLSVVSDGTSNTILFSEATRLNVCVDNVSVGGTGTIVDGTSNTLLFGEGTGLAFISGGLSPRVPISTIVDGSSNTILFGELTDSFCLRNVVVDDQPPGEIQDGTSNTIMFGENSRFDICVAGAQVTQRIVDGTSNTILIGETPTTSLCFEDVRVAATDVPEPGTMALLLAGLAPLVLWRRRQRVGTGFSPE
jgi:hypothetical protein